MTVGAERTGQEMELTSMHADSRLRQTADRDRDIHADKHSGIGRETKPQRQGQTVRYLFGSGVVPFQ